MSQQSNRLCYHATFFSKVNSMICIHVLCNSSGTFLSCWLVNALAGPGGGAHPAPHPRPNGRGPMICYVQNANFSHFFSSLASLAINLKHNFNRNMAKTC